MVLSDTLEDFDVIDVPILSGVLGMSPLPGRSGDYSGDFQKVLGWAPKHVLTLCQHHELEQCGAISLGQDCGGQGIAWHYFPIEDFGVPGPLMGPRWLEISHTLRRELKRGGRVLVHCFGGRGRSGMVAARLLVETGERPKAALAQVRDRRPGAVETSAQEAWIVEGR